MLHCALLILLSPFVQQIDAKPVPRLEIIESEASRVSATSVFFIRERCVGLHIPDWPLHVPEIVLVVFEQRGISTTVRARWCTPQAASETADAELLVDISVPEGLTPGACRISIEHDNLRSDPVDVEVTAWEPPQLWAVTDKPVAPGDMLGLFGRGLHENDVFELVDSAGSIWQFGRPADTPIGEAPIPERFPTGKAKIRVVGPGGANGPSTQWFPFRVVARPLPLVIADGCVPPSAPGQSVDIAFATDLQQMKIDMVEVEFIQDGNRQNVYCQDIARIRTRIPQNLHPGLATVVARAWRGHAVGDWSEPISIVVLALPANATEP